MRSGDVLKRSINRSLSVHDYIRAFTWVKDVYATERTIGGMMKGSKKKMKARKGREVEVVGLGWPQEARSQWPFCRISDSTPNIRRLSLSLCAQFFG